jgi:uncharacterized protein (DUF427 family)
MLSERIGIFPAEGTWVVRAGGAVIGESTRALELVEEGYPSVIYFPREDVGMAFLEPSATLTTSPQIGQARHFDIAAKSGAIADAAWSFEAPRHEARRLAGHIAFDRYKTTVEQL